MLYSKLYQLETHDTEWQIAHLFEHLLIRTFYAQLAHKMIPSEMISWVNGETFKDILFIDTLFYTKDLADEFNTYITKLPIFTQEEIAHSIAALQAEDKIILSINDTIALQNELQKLSQREWSTPQLPRKEHPQSAIITEKQSAKSFRDIVIITKAMNLTHDEQKVFLRLRILLVDLVANSLIPINGIYQGNDSSLALQHQDMAFMTKYTVTKGTTLRQLNNALSNVISIEQARLEKIIKNHFEVFASEPTWQDMPIEYFRQTGIVTNNQEIAQLATPKTVKSILQKTSFEAVAMTPAHKKFID